MNVEFVSLILLGINNFMENLQELKDEDIGSHEKKVILIQKDKENTKLTFDAIKFKNIKIWDIANVLESQDDDQGSETVPTLVEVA